MMTADEQNKKAVEYCEEFPGIKVLIVNGTEGETLQRYADVFRIFAESPLIHIGYFLSARNGSTVYFRTVRTDSDSLKLCGAEFDIVFIGPDTHLESNVMQMLASSVRGPENFPKKFISE